MPRLPAEWEPHSAVMLTWPHDETAWRPQLAQIEGLYTELAAAIAAYEPVLIVCRDAAHREQIAARLDAADIPSRQRHLALAPSNDTWTRDHGPLTVLDGDRPLLLDCRFNGWGAKFPAGLDDRITQVLHQAGVFGDIPLRQQDLVLEGGAIDTDGDGTLLAMTRTLVDPKRNPHLTRAAIEARLAELLGTRRVLWIEEGQLSGDDTDGHIDTLARFCAPDTIAYVQCQDPNDTDFPGLAAMERELQGLRQASGAPYRLVPLPCPAPVLGQDGQRLAASYANFLIINGAVLVPVYRDPADQTALARIADLFPGREVRPLDCRRLIEQGGSLHCATMQLPTAVRLPGTHRA
ncbi:agmatine deiminase family protein [Thioalkalicoccus limnaeus]|uniref:Agmatine deiminase family protein n=1 Tax=Thioalkalicoccus limnaeus TaxID=120681 RepID=A0ABV4BCC4_9GAMM